MTRTRTLCAPSASAAVSSVTVPEAASLHGTTAVYGGGAAEVGGGGALPVDLEHGLLEPAAGVGGGERDAVGARERAAADQRARRAAR